MWYGPGGKKVAASLNNTSSGSKLAELPIRIVACLSTGPMVNLLHLYSGFFNVLPMCASKDIRLIRACLLAHIGCGRVNAWSLIRCFCAAPSWFAIKQHGPCRFPSHTRLSGQLDKNCPAMAQNGVVRLLFGRGIAKLPCRCRVHQQLVVRQRPPGNSLHHPTLFPLPIIPSRLRRLSQARIQFVPNTPCGEKAK